LIVYQLTQLSGVIRISDNAFIPDAPNNTDWQAYQQWVAEGNVPDPVPSSVLAVEVRAQRDGLLIASDNHALADRWAAMTTQQQQAWTQYRQDLRDVPQQQGFPQTVVWPTLPQ
jgi:hypothetical protein